MTGNDWSTYARLLGYVRPYWPLFLLAIVCYGLGSGAEAYVFKLLGDLVDQIGLSGSEGTFNNELLSGLLRVPILMFVAALGRAMAEVGGEYLMSRISFRVVHKLRLELFDSLLRLPAAFFDASSQGHLVNRITFTVAQLRDTGTDALKSLFQDSVKVVVYFGTMLYLSWKLTLVFVAAAPLVAAVVAFASRRFRRLGRRIQNSMGDVTHVASETVSGQRVVRIFGGERYESERFTAASLANTRQHLKLIVTKVTSTQIIQVTVAAALSLLIALLVWADLGAGLSAGNVVTLLGVAGLLARPIRKLSEVNAKLQRGLAAAEDVFAQLDEPGEGDRGSVDTERVAGRIEFDAVNFRYATRDEAALKDVSLTIEPGETVALVGRSGSGKSTFANLIPRFYEPTSGSIRLDGVDVLDYRRESLRRQIALVNQQVVLFNDTLARNIAYGALAGADTAAIEAVVERANATEFVERLPDGLDTLVGDDGVLLSGGQRQRVAIARALLKDAPVLILDEATSALDNESERAIQAALEEVMRGRTTLVIAHRLSTIENADRIVVLEQGEIVEMGSHAQLIEQGGAYAALYAAQFDADKAPAPPAEGNGAVTKLAQPEASLETRIWYRNSTASRLLSPAAWLFGVASRRRRARFKHTGVSYRAPVPVVIVGNISAGGTGKSPFVIFLSRWLRSRGLKVGIVSRGHGGRSSAPLQVFADSDPVLAGDEAPMLARRTGVPVYVDKDRAAAVRALLEAHAIDIVLADDGLQHYALERDVEIALIDAARGFGNGRLMPAGPLREPISRLEEVDLVVATASDSTADSLAVPVDGVVVPCPTAVVRLGFGAERLSVEEFRARYQSVVALAGIGNPQRFEASLAKLGLDVQLRTYPDHHDYDGSELLEWRNGVFGSRPLLCTEKDAMKLARLLRGGEALFYLEIDLAVPAPLERRLTELFSDKGVLSSEASTSASPSEPMTPSANESP
ncbi:MAG: lipid A export permease/ATP-binding protein MsbA [Pseudomonadota bacterium]